MGDYEIAACNSLKWAFPNLNLAGCQFHLTQNVYKRLGKLELREQYKSNLDFRKWCRAFMALPFLPAPSINPAFDLLKQQIVNFEPALRSKMQKFCKYYHRVYLTQFTAEGISVYRLARATNNEQESYHGQLKCFFLAKPGLWNFVKKLNLSYQDVAKDLLRAENGMRLVRSLKLKDTCNQKRLLELYDELDSHKRKPLSFIYAISFTIDEAVEQVEGNINDGEISEGDQN
jgi:hypothetical protein